MTFLALPLTAALTLQATPAQMGLLIAIGSLPSLVLGLRARLVLPALGEMLSISWLLLSPIRTMRAVPALVE